jgi:hypothetical protein
MIPSSEDIESMRRLRRIIENSEGTSMQPSTTYLSENKSPVTRTGRPDVDAMAEILQRFNKATNNTAQRLVEDANNDPRTLEAIHTQSTGSGVKIGKYEVIVELLESDNKTRKVYNVMHSENDQLMVKDLSVLEAAHAIVRYLNKGVPFDNNKIQSILDLEETYSRNKIDAIRFKQRYERCVKLKETRAGDVFADRFQVARANALVAHDQIKSVLESIR